MKKELINFIYITIGLFWYLTGGISHAATLWNQSPDCKMVLDPQINILQLAEKFAQGTIVPQENIQRAIYNLKGYCCNEGKGIQDKESCDDPNIIPMYPHSTLLYDHLVDVSLRSLDGENKYQGMVYYTEGEQRRTKINTIAENPQDSTPKTIKDLQEKYRSTNNKILGLSDAHNCRSNKFIITEKEYSEYSLRDKYLNQCAIQACIYQTMTYNQTKEIISANYFQKCKEMTEKRIDNEIEYIKTIIGQTAVYHLQKNSKEYLNTYFNQTRFTNLFKTVFEFTNAFGIVYKSVQEGTNMCN